MPDASPPPTEKTVIANVQKDLADDEKTVITDVKNVVTHYDKSPLEALWSGAKAVFGWIKDHVGVVAAVVGAIVLYSVTLGRRGVSPADKLAVELDAVAAKTQVADIAAQKGADAAHEHIQATYASQLAALNQEQLHAATQLKDNPGDLAAYLVRVGSQLNSSQSRQ